MTDLIHLRDLEIELAVAKAALAQANAKFIGCFESSQITVRRLVESEAVCAEKQKALVGLVELLDAHGWGEGPALRKAKEAIYINAGQPMLKFVEAARRLRDKLNTSKMLVDHAGEIALTIADFDAADEKLKGSA